MDFYSFYFCQYEVPFIVFSIQIIAAYVLTPTSINRIGLYSSSFLYTMAYVFLFPLILSPFGIMGIVMTSHWNSGPYVPLKQGCQTHFHWRPHQPHGCLQRTKCNFNSLTVKEYLHLYSPKVILALWRQQWGWCGPQWKWVGHLCTRERL